MNGTPPTIGVIRPFNEAVELTKRILFQPFDLKKWLIIGFGAWLMHIGGGFNFDYSYNRRTGFRWNLGLQGLTDSIHQIPGPILVVLIIALVLVILGLAVLFAWLRARGRFIFTDCVVRNRAAVVEPWREFARQGNSFFFLSLVVAFAFLIMAAVLSLPLVAMIVRDRMHHHGRHFVLIGAIVLWASVIFVAALAWILIAHIMTPIMYRRRCLAGEAFQAAISLINQYPGEITLYCLFLILLGIGAAVAFCLLVCLTCCIVALPYIGTVIALPIYMCLHTFGLLFIRQFGNDYDAWAALPPVPVVPAPPPPPAPPTL